MDYFDKLTEAIDLVSRAAVFEVVSILKDVQLINSKSVFVVGNGGSAATAMHMAGDLSKNARPPIRAYDLNNLTALTATANDDGYRSCYANQLRVHARPGDVLIAISTSGNSENVLAAYSAAKEMQLETISLTGWSGGALIDMGGVNINVPVGSVEMVEDVHMAVCHAIISGVKYG